MECRTYLNHNCTWYVLICCCIKVVFGYWWPINIDNMHFIFHRVVGFMVDVGCGCKRGAQQFCWCLHPWRQQPTRLPWESNIKHVWENWYQLEHDHHMPRRIIHVCQVHSLICICCHCFVGWHQGFLTSQLLESMWHLRVGGWMDGWGGIGGGGLWVSNFLIFLGLG